MKIVHSVMSYIPSCNDVPSPPDSKPANQNRVASATSDNATMKKKLVNPETRALRTRNTGQTNLC
ncbi:hypothetical protein ALQ03_200018 [Pseudomonas savastanoi pv. glycinea]|nr:hypothetical protein ALQ43_200012 [Pseudomonas savastanoi pv. glycinea]RMP93790.1 hypothetical protein ALQ13_200037 [Pseudomonas savastanoi pv. glycinea]RMQ51000.1 hypothetical protein ALQ03_200018 [Pseudomonas savastanoi pv. glycinea]RMR40074.1 hypothetical protein ALP88_200091 [Pseudomonas savastanoi pv. glycinea]RMU55026.1 hypothetical protein ALP27_200182 [Pseudomonas savastanoi pv. glycinea]